MTTSKVLVRPAIANLHSVGLVFVLIVVAVAYWPGLGGGFVFDDFSNLVLNTNLHVTSLRWNDWVAAALSSPATDLQRPVAMLSFAANHYFTGLDPWSMKLTNLIIHLANTCLVFGLSRQIVLAFYPNMPTDRRSRVSLFISACWALMPINLMAVLLVVQRMESLSHVFVFGGLWLYLCGRQRLLKGQGGWGYVVAGLLIGTGLGALSKESAVLLPLYAACIELYAFKLRGRDGSPDRKLAALFIAVLVVPAILGVAWLLPASFEPGPWLHRNFSLMERLLTEPRVVLDYLQWTVIPNLGQMGLFHDDYPVSRGLLDPPATSLALLGILALAAVAWACVRRRPLIGLGIAWFLCAQLLTATFLPLELMFEHRNYFASLGICLVLADFILLRPLLSDVRYVSPAVACLLLACYGVSTHLRALEWDNPIRFAQTEAEKHPASPRATYHLAQTLAGLSYSEPNSIYTSAAFEAYEQALNVPNATIAPAQGALLLAARTGKPLKDAWWEDIDRKLRNQPIGPQELGSLGALVDCAVSQACRFPPERMIGMFSVALSRGDHPEILNIYGNYALNVLHDVDLAERLWKEASRLSPKEPQYVISLAKLMIWLGRRNEAKKYIFQLRQMGRLGQYQGAADDLEIRMTRATAPVKPAE